MSGRATAAASYAQCARLSIVIIRRQLSSTAAAPTTLAVSQRRRFTRRATGVMTACVAVMIWADVVAGSMIS